MITDYIKKIPRKLLIPFVVLFAFGLIIFSYTLVTVANAYLANTQYICTNGYVNTTDDNGNVIPEDRRPATCGELGNCPTEPNDPNDPNDTSTVTCTTNSCVSAPNICGDINTGSYTTCSDGSGNGCNASIPPNPSGTCSVSTECGVAATGYNGCSSTCNITRYPFCKTVIKLPKGVDPLKWKVPIEWVSLNPHPGVTDITAYIFLKPNLVSKGNPTVVRWLSTETESCKVTSSGNSDNWTGKTGEKLQSNTYNSTYDTYAWHNKNGYPYTRKEVTYSTNSDNWTGKTGEKLSSNIYGDTIYTLECVGYDGSTIKDSAKVRIVPVWQEF